MDYVKGGYQAATSRTAQRALLKSIFFVCGSVALLGLSSIAYILFYRNYLPDQILTIPLHLQYGHEQENPYAIAHLSGRNLKELQDYDVAVSLSVPRSPANTERGNFMLSLYLSDTILPPPNRLSAFQSDPKTAVIDRQHIVYSSSRPALIPYTDPVVSLASRMLFLAYYIFFPTSERTTLMVPMAERLSFPRSQKIPASLLVEVATASGELPLRTYSADIIFTAQLSGLRWMMYHHRIISFVLFTSLFWVCSLFSMVAAWLLVALCLRGGGEDKPAAETTAVVRSDGKGGPTGLPSTPLRNPGERSIKKEEDPDDEHGLPPVTPVTPRTLASSSRGAPPSYETGSAVGAPDSSISSSGPSKANTGVTMRQAAGGQLPSAQSVRDAAIAGEDLGYGDEDTRLAQWRMEYAAAGTTGHDDGGGTGSGAGSGPSSLRRRPSQRSNPAG